MLPDRVAAVRRPPLPERALERRAPVRGDHADRRVRGFYEKVVTLDRTAGRVGVIGGFGIGAPVAAVVLEELIAIGVREFLSIGTAGGLQPDLAPGDVVVCTGAVRDEGVSHHYTASETPAEPDSAAHRPARTAIDAAGLPARRGMTWTIDTPYRETAAEARHYQADGVQCVEMEALPCSRSPVIVARRSPPRSASAIRSPTPSGIHSSTIRTSPTTFWRSVGAAVDTVTSSPLTPRSEGRPHARRTWWRRPRPPPRDVTNADRHAREPLERERWLYDRSHAPPVPTRAGCRHRRCDSRAAHRSRCTGG